MNEFKSDLKFWLANAPTIELWRELGRRFKVEYGRVQMSFHKGEPSKYTEIESKIPDDRNFRD
jgi:hypothetical protein